MVEVQMRPVRLQRNVLSRLEALAVPATVTAGLKNAMETWARSKAIPRFQAEYGNVRESDQYVRTYDLYFGWTYNIAVSHGSIAVVFSNNANHGGRYWQFVMHDAYQSFNNTEAGWATIQQILDLDPHVGGDLKERAQSWINRHL